MGLHEIKFIFLMLLFILALNIHTHAVDGKVPAGNVPLPSASSTIPANAYETYSKVRQQQEDRIVSVHDSKNNLNLLYLIVV